jgi:hypothetical protein
MSADDTAYETAMNSLGLLTATFHDGYQFGPTTMDYLGRWPLTVDSCCG